MKYSTQMFAKRAANTFQFITFFTEKDVYSQWYQSDFTETYPDGKSITFSCCEQYMMYHKAKLFKDDMIASEVLQETSQGRMKALGRKVENFDNKIWDQHKYSIVKQGNLLKFSQNADLKKEIMQTPDKDIVFVEASPYDKIWGVGLDKTDREVRNPEKWKGQNLLGFALTEVRNELLNKKFQGIDE